MNNNSLMILCLVIILSNNSSAKAGSTRRISYSDSIMAESSLTTEESVLKRLKLQEIQYDEKTIVNIHTENTRIDFNCIDCIVKERGTNEPVMSAWNGRMQ